MEIQDLTVSERIILAEKLWDSVLDSEAEIKLTKSQKAELDRRLDKFLADNDPGSPWSEVKERIIARK